MDNIVIFAAAGHGKTFSLCSHARDRILNTKKYVLMISYTNEGIHALEKEYRKQNEGVLDDRIIIKSWYSLLLSDFIKPYQCTLALKSKHYKQERSIRIPDNYVSSIAFYNTEQPPRWYNSTHIQYFLNQRGDVIPDRASHLAFLCNEHSKGKAIARMEQIYSDVLFDELQDYAGWDLELISLLFKSKIKVTCVGDYKQATYRTNISPKNSQYRDENIRNYFKLLESRNLCSISYANTTRRFNQEICDFINTIHGDVESVVSPEPDMKFEGQAENTGVYLIDQKYLSDYCSFYSPVILRYDKNSKINFYHECRVYNYGGSKGATYERVVVIPVSTSLPFIENGTKIASSQTRSKFYVACTRAKYSVVFAMNDPKSSSQFKATNLYIGGKEIPSFKFIK